MDGQPGAAGLDFELCERALRRLIQGSVTYPATAKRLDLKETEIAELERLRDRVQRFSDQQFDYAIRIARTRLANQQFFAGYAYKLVSLGTDCLSRTIPTRWGLKPPKSLGERTHPFDLAVHPYEAVCEVLDRDFVDYLDARWLETNVSNYVIHKKLKVQFNHEKGAAFSENSYSQFIEHYRRRIDNLRDDIARHPILYVLHLKSSRIPFELFEIVARKTSHAFTLLVISTADEPYPEIDAADTPANMLLEHIPLPYPDYVWHMPAHYSSSEGQNFEERIAAAVGRAIVERFGPRLPTPAISQPVAAPAA